MCGCDRDETAGRCAYHDWYLELNTACAVAERLNCSVMDLDKLDALFVNRTRAAIIAEQKAETHKQKPDPELVH